MVTCIWERVMVAAAVTRPITPRTRVCCWARCYASTWTAAHPTPFQRAIPSLALATRATKSGASACAIPGDLETANSPGGLNWGWDCYEGTHPYLSNPSLAYCTGLTFTWPVYEYSQSSVSGCAVTGGYVYRGSPNSTYFGDYLFADYCVGNRLWSLRFNGSTWVATQHTLVPPTGLVLNNPASFGQDAYGDLYVTDDSGEVFKIALRPAQCVTGNYDVNGDGQVDIVDVQLVAADFMRPDFVPDYDVNCTGAVDATDITLVAAAWQ